MTPPIPLFFFVLLLILPRPPPASPFGTSDEAPPSTADGTDSSHDFDVHLDPKRKAKLGMHMSSDLHVLSFETSAGGQMPWIYE
jgi:hypothetical protein